MSAKDDELDSDLAFLEQWVRKMRAWRNRAALAAVVGVLLIALLWY